MNSEFNSSLRDEVLQHFSSAVPLEVEPSLDLLSRVALEVQADERVNASIFPAWFLLEEVPDTLMKFLVAPPSTLVFDHEDFLPPEFLKKGGIDERSMVFALGVTGFKLLTGNAATYSRPTSTRRSIQGWMEGIVRPISEVLPSCPVHVTTFIERALKRSPEERQQSVAEFLNELQAVRFGNVR